MFVNSADNLKALEEAELEKPPTLCSDATLEYNVPKNRYVNILPCNATRVRLAEDYGSDYFVSCKSIIVRRGFGLHQR